MSKVEEKQPIRRSDRRVAERLWRIGDRDIPQRVASQQSPLPLLPAQPSCPINDFVAILWTSEPSLVNPFAKLIAPSKP